MFVDAGLFADVLLDVLDDGRVGDFGEGDGGALFLVLVLFVFAAGEAGEEFGGLVGGELVALFVDVVVGCGFFNLLHGDGGGGLLVGGLLRLDDGLFFCAIFLLLLCLGYHGGLDLGRF